NNHGKEPIILVGNEEQKLKRNTLVAIIPRLSNEWIVSLNVRLHSPLSEVNFQNMWVCNIVHFTQGGHSLRHQYGDRTPLIGIGKTTSKFHITNAVNNDPIFNFNNDGVGNVLTINQTYHLEVHQRYVSNGDYRYFITIDGEELYSVLNTDARQFYDVKVFMSNDWQIVCPVYISNFEITNFL
uniref:Uncharacterized protein n=1 Tax=Clytia hemisphaerica TaxID=252671 RepID=A0A7M5UU39_9CNID